MILEYIIIGFLFVVLLWFIVIKITFPFWSHQPVVHSYDWMRRWIFYSPYVIQTKHPHKTKYVDMQKVYMKPFLDLNKEEIQIVVDFLQCHYFSDESVFLVLSENILRTLLSSHEESYVSFLFQDKLKLVLNDEENSAYVTKLVLEKEPQGVLCSYSLPFFFIQQKESPIQSVMYWDYVSIHRENKTQKDIYTLLQTHDYWVRLQEPGCVSLFKKEGDLCSGVIPLVLYHSHLFVLNEVAKPKLEDHVSCVRVGSEQFHLLSDVLYSICRGQTGHYFDCACFPSLPALQERLKQDMYFCYVVRRKEQILGMIMLKDTFQHNETHGNILECGCCFLNDYGHFQEEQFFGYFLHALYDIQKHVTKKFKLLLLNDLGHNILLLDKWRWKYSSLETTPCAYYLFNGGTAKMPFAKQYMFMGI